MIDPSHQVNSDYSFLKYEGVYGIENLMRTYSHSDQRVDNSVTSGNDDGLSPRKRRLRYSGKYPKNFIEKYKEQSGDRDTVKRVLEKGSTPAGQHVPIMVDECMRVLNITRESSTTIAGATNKQIIIDCTLGFGGHSLRMLKDSRLNCELITFDRDAIELAKTTDRIKSLVSKKLESLQSNDQSADKIFVPIHDSFQNVLSHLDKRNYRGKVDAVLADLGLSSMQIDNPSRGFTYKSDGPLDMRMDMKQPVTALTVLQINNIDSLTEILSTNSDEPFAAHIARSIYERDDLPVTTFELAESVRQGVRSGHKAMKLPTPVKVDFDKAITRTMQAIRIEVNLEFQALDQLLLDLPKILRPGGRVAILSFHSGEDRRVKKSFKEGLKQGIYDVWSEDVIRPSYDEKGRNPRSKCAKLRLVDSQFKTINIVIFYMLVDGLNDHRPSFLHLSVLFQNL